MNLREGARRLCNACNDDSADLEHSTAFPFGQIDFPEGMGEGVATTRN